MRSQLVCNGCRSILVYPRGATNVCCALCNTITSVPPPGIPFTVSLLSRFEKLSCSLMLRMDMSQLYCGGCTTLLMYTRGATSVRCSCCHTINLVPACPVDGAAVQVLQMTNGRLSIPVQRPNGTANSGTVSSTSSSMPYSLSQTVVVENPMSVDSSGKLVRNVVVGVTTDKK
ncbi:Protein LSD1 [Glycine soja]